MIDFDINLAPVGSIMGAMEGISATVNTKTHINDVLKHTHRILSVNFNQYMHAVARSNPKGYHHVYEWGHVGVPGYQLWENELKGAGRNKVRTFKFRPSVTAVPKPDIQTGQYGQMSNKDFVFSAKAPIMEYGIPVHIDGDVLMIYLGEGGVDNEGNEAEFIFRKGPITVQRPGGNVKGNFTQQFILWNSSMAEDVFATQVAPLYENEMQTIMTRAGKVAKRQRIGRAGSKQMSLAFDASYAAARAETLSYAAKQAQASRLVERFG